MGEGLIEADPTNQDQVDNWNGPGGDFWAAQADQFDDSMARYHEAFFEAAAIDTSHAVLDVGCGAGGTTLHAASLASAGRGVGVDLSGAMLQVARNRASHAKLVNVEFHQVDAQVHAFEPASFDLAISRNGTMFFGDTRAAFANIASAIRPSGRLVLLVWQSLAVNEWASKVTHCLTAGRDLPPPPINGPGPFSLGDPDRLRAILESTGFHEVQITGVRQDLRFGSTVQGATTFLLGTAGGMLNGLDEKTRAAAIDKLSAMLSDHLQDEGVLLASAAWLVQATRRSG